LHIEVQLVSSISYKYSEGCYCKRLVVYNCQSSSYG